MRNLSLSSELLVESSIPSDFWELGCDTYWGDDEARKKVEKYVRDSEANLKKGLGLFITGNAYSCKTFLLTYALRLLMVKHYNVCYSKLFDLKEKFFKRDATQPFGHVAREGDYMGIDAIHEPNNGTDLALDAVIQLRKDDRKPLLLVSDLDFDHFRQVYKRSTGFFVEAMCY